MGTDKALVPVAGRPMAEWVLGMIICFAKNVPQTLASQARGEWQYRLSETVAGKRALVVGVGSIGRAVGRLLQTGVSRVKGYYPGDPAMRQPILRHHRVAAE